MFLKRISNIPHLNFKSNRTYICFKRVYFTYLINYFQMFDVSENNHLQLSIAQY